MLTPSPRSCRPAGGLRPSIPSALALRYSHLLPFTRGFAALPSMPWLNFEMFLPDGFSVMVDAVRHRGRVTSFVVRLMYEDLSGPVNITRYDGAHGVPHRDQMSRSGRLASKTWMHGVDFEAALEYAVKDLKQNYRAYYEAWLQS